MNMLYWVALLFLFQFSHIAHSQSYISNLPGFSSKLPFKLETGYVGVGENEDVQLFYYFIESERDAQKDPLLLWLTGGPGCSGLSGLIYEIGPITFNYKDFDGDFPTLVLNPYSWTKVASIIFLDAPVGTGFSYARNSESYNLNDTLSSLQTYEFLKKWLNEYPRFKSNEIYVGGDSYSGIIVPMIVELIYNENITQQVPLIKLKGYFIGNPVTDQHNDKNTMVKYAHRMGLLSDQLYEAVKTSCNGEYVIIDPNNAQCAADLKLVEECIAKINVPHILEPNCDVNFFNSTKLTRRSLEENPMNILLARSQVPELWCRGLTYVLSYIWANDKRVQDSLNIREGTTKMWVRCNRSMSYTEDVLNSFFYHQNLSKSGYRALIYSGDHDLSISYLGTLEWITVLNMSITNNWQPWFVDGQIAGYTMKFTKNQYILTFATVKGAGHTAPEYKPKECLAMVDRWFAHYDL